MHLVFIGNGITGVTAALTARRLQPEARITLVSAESAHHFSRPALMYVYLGDMRYQDIKPYEDWFWTENRLELVHATATGLDTTANTVQLDDGTTLRYDKLLLATGSRGRRGTWPGSELGGVQTFVTLPDLELMTRDTRQGVQQAVIVGGGLIGVELAEMLAAKGVAVTMLIRDARYWGAVLPPEEAALVQRQLDAHHIVCRYETELQEILADESGRVRAVRTKTGEELPCQWLGLAIGVEPNLDLAKVGGLETDKGVLVDQHLQTSAPHVYAAGDCAQLRAFAEGEVAVEQLWYTGRQQGETVAYTLCNADAPRSYQRGQWFNSAKFFDLEYQTYGRVPAELAVGEHSFCWQHPTREALLRINFRPGSLAVTGLNVLGLRQRHDTWAAWLQAGTPVTEVLANLGAANFDPEFFRQYEAAIVTYFNQQFPQHAVQLRRRKGLFSR
ncbi:NAD(P)/FAD-dependent oxidoreductase [Hymenobacter psychrophilus]|uniref:Pyridine nucleotide-disulphide oxidoreductase n=1 Tax=Hymenobacter psychrophilus TaxID=651662 RepID=A0A1H3C0Q3_9BACT|nr:FAD-dependent oxidoreductase [Hymenobacter psychrophilus]SDX47676.1 Pyridine nucleotide-disulphide oxidoreductase [Hymenobacter psychrophilus]